jgi:hypothetical protein
MSIKHTKYIIKPLATCCQITFNDYTTGEYDEIDVFLNADEVRELRNSLTKYLQLHDDWCRVEAMPCDISVTELGLDDEITI